MDTREKVNLNVWKVVVISGVSVIITLCLVGIGLYSIVSRSMEKEAQLAPATSTERPTPKITNTPRPTRTPRPTSTPKYGAMDNPIEFGDYAYLVKDGTVDFRVSIVSVVRGQEALDIVLGENQFNEIPTEGMEYIVFIAEIAYTGNGEGILNVSDYDWGVLTSGRIFDWTLSVCCFEGVRLARGGVADETVALQVYEEDKNPLLIFGEKFYFKTH